LLARPTSAKESRSARTSMSSPGKLSFKYAIRPRVLLRIEVRDYFSRFPTRVIAPAPGSHLAGWLHDVVPMVGITFVF